MVATSSPSPVTQRDPAHSPNPNWLPSLVHRFKSLCGAQVPTELRTMRAGEKSVKGNYRMSNQDRCLADTEHGVFMVVDGVGGDHGGEEAAEILIRTVAPQIAEISGAGGLSVPTLQSIVCDAIQTARREMLELASFLREYRQMGATAALAFVVEGKLCVSHVGDCRVYLMHDQSLTQLTVDQTFVQVAIDSGMLTPEQAREHPWRHVVTNAVGVKPLDQPPDLSVVDLAPGDRILLCSDGLTGVVDDRRLRELLAAGDDPQTTVERMIEEALGNESQDNVTCVVFDIATAEEVTHTDEAVLVFKPYAS